MGQVTNPLGAFQSISDYTTFEDPNGISTLASYHQEIKSYRANATITAGDIVKFVAPTTTVPLSVTPTTDDATLCYLTVGVARNAAAAGEICEVVVKGFAVVNVGTQDPVFGSVCSKNAETTAGVAEVILTASWDGSDVAFTALGVFVSADDATGSTTQAVVYIP